MNTQYISQSLIIVYQGGSFLNFSVFGPLFDLLPGELNGEVGYNALSDDSQYHPYIFYASLIIALRKFRYLSLS